MLKDTLNKIKDIKVYTPCSFKTGIKGFWIDKAGVLYEDNILIQSASLSGYNRIKHLLYKAGELAIFHVKNETAYIEDKKGLTVLKNTQDIIFSKYPHELILKSVCEKFGGCTVFKIDVGYKIVIWY